MLWLRHRVPSRATMTRLMNVSGYLTLYSNDLSAFDCLAVILVLQPLFTGLAIAAFE